jgi:hypothetical protein
MNGTTNQSQRKLPQTAREFLRRDPGAQARIARRLRVNRSTVCRVLAGEKTSHRVAQAIVREISRLARLYGAAAILADVESAQR